MSREYKKIFFRHHKKIVKILKKQKILYKEYAEVEAAAASFTTIFLAMAYGGHNYVAVANDLESAILRKIRRSLSGKPDNYFRTRCDFYNSMISERYIHAIALLGNAPEDVSSKFPMKLTLAMLDCLLCPECILSYDNAALPLFDIFQLVSLPKNVIVPVADELLFIMTETLDMKK